MSSSTSVRSSPSPSIDAPPAKRFRFDETSVDPTLDEFIEVIGNDKRELHGYPVHKSRSTFRIKKFPAHPESVIFGLFNEAVARACIEAKAKNIVVDTVSVAINSEHLEEGQPIYSGFRPLHADTLKSLETTFMKVEQSREPLGKSLFNAPLDIEVTVLQKAGLSKKPKKLSGGGAPRRGSFHHNVADREKMDCPTRKGNRCLFYALHIALQKQIRGLDGKQWNRYRRGVDQWKLVHKEVEQLMRTLNIPLWEKKYAAQDWVPTVVNYWNEVLHKDRYRIKVWFFDERGIGKPAYKFGPKDYNVQLVIYHEERQINNNEKEKSANEGEQQQINKEEKTTTVEHFVALTSSGALFGKPYCLDCESSYARGTEHRIVCKRRCRNCGRVGPEFPCEPEAGVNQVCKKCDKTFISQQCYAHHLKNGFCAKSKQCKCGVIWDPVARKKNGHQPHNCGEKWCHGCVAYHEKNDKFGCFIKPLEVKPAKPVRFIAFDLETTIVERQIPSKKPNVPPKIQKTLVANFISAQVACQQCIVSGEWKQRKMGTTPCEVCGPHRTLTFGTHAFQRTHVDRSTICNDPNEPSPITQFTQWLLSLSRKYQSYIFSHYGGKFDIHFVIVELYKAGLEPDLIRRGNKIITMDYDKLLFRDSFNLFPMKLEQLPSAFGLAVEDKGQFPHKLNRAENFGKTLYPQIDDYMAHEWKPEKCERFMETFESKPFLLDEEIATYCTNDTEILMHALVAFRQEFMEISKRMVAINEKGEADRAGHLTERHPGIDPLTTSATVARACVNLFMANHLPTHHLARVPEGGYDRYDNQSRSAYEYLRWLEEAEGVPIQHAYTEGGEKRFGQYRVDGYYERKNEHGETVKRVIVEVNGCPYHGCARCFPNDHEEIPKVGKTPAKLRARDANRNAYLSKCVDRLDIVWTCEIDQMKRDNPVMRKRCAEYKDRSPLDPRDAFFGGRTGPSTLFYEAQENEKISYYDFTSLYPYVNYMTEEWMRGYPVGHPKVLIKNEPVNWTCAADNPYKTALIKCFVIPPRQIDVPILPMKVRDGDDERLLFPLCSKCARAHKNGGYYPHYRCTHTDEQRGWTASCTSVELDAALEEGYRVTELARLYEYEHSDRELFRGYMKEMLAMKIHASGFDKSIAGNTEEEERFIRECKQKFGITIDRLLMKMDKGKRALAKLIVNNLWGRFGMRNWGLYKTAITDDPAKLGELFYDHSIQVLDIDELIEGHGDKCSVILITYVTKKGCAEENDASNVIVSLWTTSCARLVLLRSMQKVVRTPGCKLHYVDTDSLIFSHPKDACPLQLGRHIGDFTDELPDHDILEVCFGGPKQYGIKMRKKNQPDAPFEYMLKIRGITLSYDVMKNQGLQYAKLKELVLKYADTGVVDHIDILYSNFLRTQLKKGAAEGAIISAVLQKRYKPVVSKGMIKKGDYKIYNYGENF